MTEFKKRFDSPVTHTPEEYDYPDRLYQDDWEKAEAYGIDPGDPVLQRPEKSRGNEAGYRNGKRLKAQRNSALLAFGRNRTYNLLRRC